HDHAEHGDQQQEADNLHGQQVGGEELFAVGLEHRARGRNVGRQLGGDLRAALGEADQPGDEQAGGDDAGGDGGLGEGATLAAAHVEQHDDEEEQRDDRAGVNQHHEHGQEEGLKQREDAGDADQGQQKAKRGGDGVAVEHHAEGARHGEDGEEVEENGGHGRNFRSGPQSSQSSDTEVTEIGKVRAYSIEKLGVKFGRVWNSVFSVSELRALCVYNEGSY